MWQWNHQMLEKKEGNHQMWQKYYHMWCWSCTIWGCYYQMWEKNTNTIKCSKSTVKCEVSTAQCDNETIKCEKK